MKRFLVVVLVLLAACSLFATGKPEPTKPAASAAPADLKGEVNLFAWLPDNPDIPVSWAKKFNEKYPGIKVNIQMMTGNTLIENMQPRLASNNMPDVFSNELDPFSKSFVTLGKIVDLGGTRAWADLVPAMQAAWTFEGMKYGISGGVCTTLFFYNKDYFKKAGITAPPKDWQEFLTVCEKLKAAGIVPLVWYGGFPNMLSNGPTSWSVANDVVTREPDVFKNLFAKKYDFTANPGWQIAFEKMDLLNKKGYFMKGFTSTDYGQGQEFFNNGDAAMFFAVTWQAAYVIDKGKFDTGLFLPPWNEPGKELVVVNASETGWSVGKTGHENLGLLLLDSMFADNWAIYQNPRGCVTPFKSAKGDVLNPKLAPAMTELNKYPKFVDLWTRLIPTPLIGESLKAMQMIYIDKTPKEALQIMAKAQNDWFATK
jgi:multiple sugar transport system substrate-binding protein